MSLATANTSCGALLLVIESKLSKNREEEDIFVIKSEKKDTFVINSEKKSHLSDK